MRAVVCIGLAASASALRMNPVGTPLRSMRDVCATPALIPATPRTPALRRAAFGAVMQQPSIDEKSAAFFDEFVQASRGVSSPASPDFFPRHVLLQRPPSNKYYCVTQTDPVTGESTAISLDEKEKLYLECLDAYYNEGGKQLLGDDEYEQLKLDLDFEGAKIATFTKDEIQFVLANKRFKMGKPTLNDAEYDTLREKLRSAGSSVVIHQGASCNPDTGLCKTDLSVDSAKTRLLYLPGSAAGLILVCEAEFWTLGLDPIFSIILGAVPAYFFGVWFTENIFAQRPLVTQGTCPECQSLETFFFGDLFSVGADNIIPDTPIGDEVSRKCVCCKSVVSRAPGAHTRLAALLHPPQPSSRPPLTPSPLTPLHFASAADCRPQQDDHVHHRIEEARERVSSYAVFAVNKLSLEWGGGDARGSSSRAVSS